MFYLLLRLWYELFGWSEASGRMLSVVIGLAGIVSLYWFVKPVCGRKHAFLSAFLLTASISHIGYSNQMRAAILVMTLVPVVSRLFFCLLERGGIKLYVLYILAGGALVNTHYYGILLIGFNFFYYAYAAINQKHLFTTKTAAFLAVHGMIALSLLPFFAITAFQKALLNGTFNTWIPRTDKTYFIAFIRIFLMCLFISVIKRRSKTVRAVLDRYGGICEYAVYASSFIFITAYIVSLKRPILTSRYLSICLPLVFSAVPAAVFYGRPREKADAVIRFLMVFVLINFSCHFGYFGGRESDVYKEAQEYISADAAAHSVRAAELNDSDPSYYNLAKITPFTGEGEYDVVYLNPLHIHNGMKDMLRRLSDAGLDGEDILWIRTTRGKFILKKYLAGNTGS
ncbi:MAG: glycosyltransferase family 39 protein [Treponema sp.]|nr:glycosyltransferase family 39 protein [Treponema sp.]